ncbi:piggyBac transposable element-derived protein 2-like [Onthophagus taurus]|uniref:piggyBac transposable element-derived protein 2-like n=1 Tax=Onthophagus taurus TaxID=166361 RepID=UPI0039BDECD7
MFWENASDAHHEIVINGMKRDRFEAILSHFHLANNYELDAEDKYAKIRPLVTMINEKFLCYAPIEEYYSFDESMCKYFGRHGLKQFIRGKPIRFGFKIWCGATRLGYVVNVDPYQGKNGYKEKDDLNLGLGGQLVYKFAKILKSQNPNPFHLFCDNFFTSIKLISELQKIGIRATGTIKENRSEHCPLLTKQNMKKESRGFYDYRVDESQELIVCKWNDNNVVSLCSNSVGINPVHSTTRFSRAGRKRIQIDQPHLIKLYNENMGGVDRMDQNVSKYRIAIHGKKWYWSLITFFIDMAVNNAFQLYRQKYNDLDLLAFRRRIARFYMEHYSKTSKKRNLPCQVTTETRYDGLYHFVCPQENQTRCGLCHTKCTTRCVKCNKGVHVKCFISYHTKCNTI